MKRRRRTFFVCSAIIDGNLVSKEISAASENGAASLFQKETNFSFQKCFGPFYKKKIIKPKTIKFSNQTRKAIYQDWEVNAFLLNEPKNHAYLIFIKRTDNQSIPIPTETIITSIDNLRFLC